MMIISNSYNGGSMTNDQPSPRNTEESSSGKPLFIQPRKKYCFLNAKQWSRIGLAMLYFLVGGLFYYYAEGWDAGDSISFAIATMSSVGYGYHHPTTDPARVFTIFYIIFGIYFVFVRLQAYLSKQMEYIANYVNSATDAANLFKDYNRHKRMMIFTMIAMFLCVIIGGAILTCLEDWTFIQGIYFAVETSSTVGYGDLKITNRGTHLFLGFYIIFSTVLLSFAFNNYQMVQAQKKQLERMERMTLRAKDLRFLCDLDENGDGISEEKFVLSILQHLGKIDHEQDVKPWLEKLRALQLEKQLEDGELRKQRISKGTLQDFYLRESLVVDPTVGTRPTVASGGSSPFFGHGRHSLVFRSQPAATTMPPSPYHYFPDNGNKSTSSSSNATEMVTRNSTLEKPSANDLINPILGDAARQV